MQLSKPQVRDLYRRRARNYDRAVWLYRAAGFRIAKYRHDTVQALSLRPGDTVVDLACGTGLNFPFLYQAVGPTGRIVGVDLTDAMLQHAQARVTKAGWANVELVQHDLADYEFDSGVGGIISVLAITLVPEFENVIRRGSEALRPGGRLAIFDFKRPPAWPEWLVRFGAWLNSPYGVSVELADRHPWEAVKRYLREVEFREYYFDALYLSVGERSARSRARQPTA
jgi:demethylmenaquinone methyltransferase/2-methoxy-6-polyprenyl-1,4-benzoquinol methylase